MIWLCLYFRAVTLFHVVFRASDSHHATSSKYIPRVHDGRTRHPRGWHSCFFSAPLRNARPMSCLTCVVLSRDRDTYRAGTSVFSSRIVSIHLSVFPVCRISNLPLML